MWPQLRGAQWVVVSRLLKIPELTDTQPVGLQTQMSGSDGPSHWQGYLRFPLTRQFSLSRSSATPLK